jgi:uncharacterized membrane protein
MVNIPRPVPPLPPKYTLNKGLPAAVAFDWLGAGWRDFKIKPAPSLFYGLAVFIVSVAVVWGLFELALDYILLPVLAGFMVVGPALAIGLYEKSRRIIQGEPVTLSKMILVKPKSGGQILFIGVLLCLLMLLWMRTAVLLYALFFGLRPFPGMAEILPILLTTPIGWSLLGVGTLIGGLFAAFSFAISAFSVPMLLNERVDALTAMGTSMALVWNNLPVMLVWGIVVLTLFLASVATGLVGLIVVFPILGHATWHAYRALRR